MPQTLPIDEGAVAPACTACRDTFLPQKKYAPAWLGDVVILGLGKSGKAAVTYCADLVGTRVGKIVVAAGKLTSESLAFAENFAKTSAHSSAVTFKFDYETIDEPFDLCIASPGISQFSDFYRSAQAASKELISELEFAWRESAAESKWVAITGTNGKTTTTSLIAHILRGAGLAAAAVGNIGDVCLTAVAENTIDIYVAEASSFQLASTAKFAPEVSVLLNITPDHLSWHKTMEEYIKAKLNVFSALTAEHGVAVIDATDALVLERVRALLAKNAFACIPLGSPTGINTFLAVGATLFNNNASWDDGGRLRTLYGGVMHDFGATDDLLIKGEHNKINALAAANAVLALGLGDEVIAQGLRTFAPLEHRIEPCGMFHGIAFFNDSKATNVDATLKAFSAFPPKTAVVLLGGRDKGTDLAPLVAACTQKAAAVVCYGESKERFLEAFRASEEVKAALPVYEAQHFADAFEEACRIALPGQAVLLSPACASFDEFSGFEERGRVFKELVAAFGAR